MKLYKCQYSDGSALGAKLQEVYEQLRSLSEGRIDGFNLSRNQLLGDGLEYGTQSGPYPPRVVNSLANTNNAAYIRVKNDAGDPATPRGIELFVDSTNSTYGRVCIGASNDEDEQQIISLYPENPESVANPGGYIDFNYGVGRLRTTSDQNLILSRNSVVQLEFTSSNAQWSINSVPASTNSYDLGTSSLAWKELYVRTIDTDGAQTLTLQSNNTTRLSMNGTGLGLYDATPVARNTGWTVTHSTGGEDKTLDMTGAVTLTLVGDVLVTVVKKLIALGAFNT
jgi:hypothetical protein